MLIQKTFHVRDGLDRTKARLRDFPSYRRSLEIVDVSSLLGCQPLRFAFVSGNGFRANVELETLDSENPNQTLFRSTGGNMSVAGLVEFIAIRDDLTEVQLTIDYSVTSPIHSVLDAVTGTIDRFVTRQLRRLQATLAGAPHEPAASGRSDATFRQPQLAR